MDDHEYEDDFLREDVEPGTPEMENVLFVLLGVLSTLAVILRFVGIL